MKISTKFLCFLGAATLGALIYKYVTDHREELDQFLEDYGKVMEIDYVEEDLIEPPMF